MSADRGARVHEETDVPLVRARGEAVLAVEPDEALVSITLTALEPDPGTALADVARRSELLVARLDELGVAKTDQATSGITVGEDFDHTPEGRRSLGHRATAQHSVRLTDPELIGRLITAATRRARRAYRRATLARRGGQPSTP
jgi:uncharacterized protein YggE